MIYRQRHDFEPPDRPERQGYWTLPRVVLVATAAVALLDGGVAIGVAAAGTDGTDTALEHARRACKGVDLAASGRAVDSREDAANQARLWSNSADEAARAARLDDAWNELARATDAQYRAWNLAAQSAVQTEIDAAMIQTATHPFQPECRKALVH